MAAKKSMKVEKYATKALMAKHENTEGKALVAMEKKMNEKDKVVTTVKGKTAKKKIVKSV